MTSREDLYLKKLNDSSVVTPQPVTQREKILSELAGVNGLGVELPTVTDTDNGKALVVDNGQWALGNASGGLQTVKDTTNNPFGTLIGDVSNNVATGIFSLAEGV